MDSIKVRKEMDEGNDTEQDRQRAEVFDALGHPTRIAILKALSEGPLGFADLKKKTTIESSGHLQHHLIKLNGLIKTDEYGKYCLSDEGKDALLTVQTVEKSSGLTKNPEKHLRPIKKKMLLKSATILLVALLIASTAIALLEYNQAANLQKENTFFTETNPEATVYHNEFGTVPLITNFNFSFSPSITIFHALLIGFEAGNWTKNSLRGQVVTVNLVYWPTASNTNYTVDANGLMPGRLVTSLPATYSDLYGDTYRCVWEIDIQYASLMNIVHSTALPYQVLVDATTGQIVPSVLA